MLLTWSLQITVTWEKQISDWLMSWILPCSGAIWTKQFSKCSSFILNTYCIAHNLWLRPAFCTDRPCHLMLWFIAQISKQRHVHTEVGNNHTVKMYLVLHLGLIQAQRFRSAADVDVHMWQHVHIYCGDSVGICSRTRVSYLLAASACGAVSRPVLPLHMPGHGPRSNTCWTHQHRRWHLHK